MAVRLRAESGGNSGFDRARSARDRYSWTWLQKRVIETDEIAVLHASSAFETRLLVMLSNINQTLISAFRSTSVKLKRLAHNPKTESFKRQRELSAS